MPNITLSFVITTFNKLDYLKVVLPSLLETLETESEEIIVSDGGSTDGTAAYLDSLYQSGKLNKYISAKDFGEAHGFNRGLLLAQGDIIKFISDDDVFDFAKIRECRSFMLEHPEIDVLGAGGMNVDISNWNHDEPNKNFFDLTEIFATAFRNYKINPEPYEFSGLGLMIRRTSIPLLGLFSTSFKWVDYEYTMRITSNPNIKLAWYTGCLFIRIANQKSVSNVVLGQIKEDQRKLSNFYKKESTPQTEYDNGLIQKIFKKLFNSDRQEEQFNPSHEEKNFPAEQNFPALFNFCQEILKNKPPLGFLS